MQINAKGAGGGVVHRGWGIDVQPGLQRAGQQQKPCRAVHVGLPHDPMGGQEHVNGGVRVVKFDATGKGMPNLGALGFHPGFQAVGQGNGPRLFTLTHHMTSYRFMDAVVVDKGGTIAVDWGNSRNNVAGVARSSW